MTIKDIDDIISVICPNDEDFEKPIISPAYLKKELEALALEQEPILDKIRAEIAMYEDDCRLQGGTDECEKCNSNVFGSIYRIIDKYKAESEE